MSVTRPCRCTLQNAIRGVARNLCLQVQLQRVYGSIFQHHVTMKHDNGRHTLEERRIGADLIEVFKMVRELSAIKLETFFQLNNTGRTRGHQWKRMSKMTYRPTAVATSKFKSPVYTQERTVSDNLGITAHAPQKNNHEAVG